MSRSDNVNQKHVDLYKLRQSAIASSLHSNLAQPIVAAKNFAAAIMSIPGDDENVHEARALAEMILEMTDQAYTVAYDLMRENDSDLFTASSESIQLNIERFAEVLRWPSRDIALHVSENMHSLSMENFLRTVVLDWVKSLFIYLTRHTTVSLVDVTITGNDLGFKLEITSNAVLSKNQLDDEAVILNIRKQIHVFDGTLMLENTENHTFFKILIPPIFQMLTVIK